MKSILHTAFALALISTPVFAVKGGSGSASGDTDMSEFQRVPNVPDPQGENREYVRKILTHVVSQPLVPIPVDGPVTFVKTQTYAFPKVQLATVKGDPDVKNFLPEKFWPIIGDIRIDSFCFHSHDADVRDGGGVNPQKFCGAVILMMQHPKIEIKFTQEFPRVLHLDIGQEQDAVSKMFNAAKYRLSLFFKTESVPGEWQALHNFAQGTVPAVSSSLPQSSVATAVISQSTPTSDPQPGAAATPPALNNDDDDDFSDFENVEKDVFEDVNIDDDNDDRDTAIKASTNGAPVSAVNVVPAPVAASVSPTSSRTTPVATAVSTASTSITPAAPSVSAENATSVIQVVSATTSGNRGSIPAGMVASAGRPVTISQGNTGPVPDEFADLRATIVSFHSSQSLTASTMPGQAVGGNPSIASVVDLDGWDD